MCHVPKTQHAQWALNWGRRLIIRGLENAGQKRCSNWEATWLSWSSTQTQRTRDPLWRLTGKSMFSRAVGGGVRLGQMKTWSLAKSKHRAARDFQTPNPGQTGNKWEKIGLPSLWSGFRGDDRKEPHHQQYYLCCPEGRGETVNLGSQINRDVVKGWLLELDGKENWLEVF